MDKKRMPHVWIDTDCGVDDAFALLMACWLEKQGYLKIEGVSAVCGNVEEEKTFQNARNVLYLAGREDIPVYPGAKKPLAQELKPAYRVHGVNGLGGACLDPSPAPVLTRPAWEALYECAVRLNGELDLILIGPDTDAAIALEQYPDLNRYLRRILIMGGALEGGNVTPFAEFNIFTDPEAASRVFESGIPVVMCGLDVTLKAYLDAEQIREVESLPTKGGKLFRESTHLERRLYERGGAEAYVEHDGCPVMYAAMPEIFKANPAGVYVETADPVRRGQTVSDAMAAEKFGYQNALAVTDVDRGVFSKVLMDALRQA